MGPVIGNWELFKSLKNETSEIVEGTKHVVTVTNGYRRESLSSIERDWRITASASAEQSAGLLTIEKVFEATVRQQFSLSSYYGGKSQYRRMERRGDGRIDCANSETPTR